MMKLGSERAYPNFCGFHGNSWFGVHAAFPQQSVMRWSDA